MTTRLDRKLRAAQVRFERYVARELAMPRFAKTDKELNALRAETAVRIRRLLAAHPQMTIRIVAEALHKSPNFVRQLLLDYP